MEGELPAPRRTENREPLSHALLMGVCGEGAGPLRAGCGFCPTLGLFRGRAGSGPLSPALERFRKDHSVCPGVLPVPSLLSSRGDRPAGCWQVPLH